MAFDLKICYVSFFVFGNIFGEEIPPSDSGYIAAVVEYSPVHSDSIEATLSHNAENYRRIIKNAATHNIDIIVFPEDGLTDFSFTQERRALKNHAVEIPKPKNISVDVQHHSFNNTVMSLLSDAAKENHLYVVVNIVEKENCKSDDHADCPADGEYFYNTNVVFDRKGNIAARCRKKNLYGEKNLSPPPNDEYCTFKTDFNVTFGIVICFDILFVESSVKLVRNHGVEDIIFSHAWLSEIPFLTAWAVQMGWAYAMNVNVLAAGYNMPEKTFGGSGIYAGHYGPLIAYKPRQTGSKTLIARIFKTIDKTKNEHKILSDINSDFETSGNKMNYLKENIDLNTLYEIHHHKCINLKHDRLNATISTFVLKNGNFFCKVTVVWKKTNPFSNLFRFIASSQNRSFGQVTTNHVQTCGLTFYKNASFFNIIHQTDDIVSLTHPNILSIDIAAESHHFGDAESSAAFIPIGLTQLFDPLDVSYFQFHSNIRIETDKHRYSIMSDMKLIKPCKDIYSFVVYRLPSNVLNDH